MLIGYARVSTQDQNLELQTEALTQAGCKKVFEDKVSGSRAERPGLAKAQEALREGDTLVVWKLDRLGRSVKNLVDLVGQLRQQGVHFKSLTDAIDTGTPSGRFFFHVMASLAEMERELTIERTRAGLEVARKLGRKGGRKRQMTDSKIKSAQKLLASGTVALTRFPELSRDRTLGWVMFKRRRFPVEIILVCVRWYCKYGISYRDLAEMMQERGVEVEPSTIMRWVHRYAPELEKRVRWYRGYRATSWRVDETYVKVGGKWKYLFRAVDKHGRLIDFMLTDWRNTRAVYRFQGKALTTVRHWPPSSITTDQLGSYPKAITRLQREGKLASDPKHRTCKYLNNITEANHGAFKRVIRPTRGFQTMKTASATIKGFEVMRMIRRGHCLTRKPQVKDEVRFVNKLTCSLDLHIRKYDFGFREEWGMSKSKHSEAQIIAALKQVEAGRTVEDVARECSVSKHTIYAWKAKFGGMDASEAQKLRSLEDENLRLKRLVADLSLTACQRQLNNPRFRAPEYSSV